MKEKQPCNCEQALELAGLLELTAGALKLMLSCTNAPPPQLVDLINQAARAIERTKGEEE